MLAAGSPVEIEAKADAAGLTPDERDAALTLFHELTSRLELSLLAVEPDGGEPWPRHRFWCGEAAAVDAFAGRLRAAEGVAEAPATAAVAFVTASAGPWHAVLAAGSARGWLDGIDTPA